MENKATQILDQKIYEIREAIIQNKLEIADLFIKVYNARSSLQPDFNNFSEMLTNMEKMSKLLSKLSNDETQLETLTKSKEEIEKAYSEQCVK